MNLLRSTVFFEDDVVEVGKLVNVWTLEGNFQPGFTERNRHMAPKNHFSGDFSFSTIDRLIGTLKTSFFVNSTIKTTIGSLQNRLIHHFNNNIAAIKGNMDALERLTLELQKIEPENDKQQERLEELTGRLLKTLEATRSAYEKTRFVWKKTEQVLGVLGGSYTTEDDVSG